MSGDVDERGRPGAHRPRRGRQHHQGDHQGHRDRHRRARRDRAVRLVLRRACAPRRGALPAPARCADVFSLSVNKPNLLFGLIIGAAVVFLFSGLAINAVARAAGRVVLEVREQFRDHPGIMDYTEKPDYGASSTSAPRTRCASWPRPGLLAVLAPIAVGFGLGYAPLGAFLAGAIAAGVLMAVFLSNSGGAWDNAKKLVEDGDARRQGLRGARGHRHRRHRRRPVQGHRRPGPQPADQGDEPRRPADRADGREVRRRQPEREHRRCASSSGSWPSPASSRAVVVCNRAPSTWALRGRRRRPGEDQRLSRRPRRRPRRRGHRPAARGAGGGGLHRRRRRRAARATSRCAP